MIIVVGNCYQFLLAVMKGNFVQTDAEKMMALAMSNINLPLYFILFFPSNYIFNSSKQIHCSFYCSKVSLSSFWLLKSL